MKTRLASVPAPNAVDKAALRNDKAPISDDQGQVT